ncbi:hypothetical protein EVAR_83000_1 [Eumeta japonica]|uniref:Uncharacterized protein n=1 Tax=Eumeta variegata TaxID=151549 RepID=A0A4C1VR84_EUMVA|nr:hypothetical protein EVAR_83000_1 [Eumeta japonica]
MLGEPEARATLAASPTITFDVVSDIKAAKGGASVAYVSCIHFKWRGVAMHFFMHMHWCSRRRESSTPSYGCRYSMCQFTPPRWAIWTPGLVGAGILSSVGRSVVPSCVGMDRSLRLRD